MKTEKIKQKRESVNEQLWRGEIEVQELIELLKKVPPDGKARIYGNKFQIMSPADDKVYTLDRVR
jgi:hypothetical protein